MLKLTPKKFEKIWGYELWIASTHKNYIQQNFYNLLKKEYPLLVKILNANDTLSVQVHPNDKTAKKLEGKESVGKTECWYVLDAQENAKLVYGLKENYTKEEILNSINEKTLESKLNTVFVKKGDFIFIPSGTVHAIGKGLTLLEIQQSCDITYRLFDWGRDREIHIEKSLESIEQKKLAKIKQFSDNFECEYFSLKKICVNGGYSFLQKDEDCSLVFAIEGIGTIKSEDEKQKIEKNDIFAIFNKEKITIEGKLELMKIVSKQ